MSEPIKLPREDIQGIILDGYDGQKAACFVLLQIMDAAKVKQWLKELPVKNSEVNPENKPCVHIAFTHSGLKKLNLDTTALAQFSGEFNEGMATEHRQRLLGDTGNQSPEQWQWGGPGKDPVHILLMLYARNDASLKGTYNTQKKGFPSNGLAEIQTLTTHGLTGNKEHFGFRDGISQPEILGQAETHTEKFGNVVATGEFLLGYENEYDRMPPSPQVKAGSILPDGDFGKNGSYLVFRQLGQDVMKFWEFLQEKTKDIEGKPDSVSMVKLAAKMVGRWPSGAPLVHHPHQDDPKAEDDNSFLYRDEDPHGDYCPVASHIRRSNPRDDLKGSVEDALEISRHHRILRRGRPYGSPLDNSMKPEKMLEADPDQVERGLHFLCFNTNISRQFEFIQNTWINNPKFEGHYNDSDPLLGSDPPQGKDKRDFTLPGEPIRKRVTGLPQFVTLQGGAYFFMPGLKAVSYLASLP